MPVSDSRRKNIYAINMAFLFGLTMPKPANEVATLQITISVPSQMGWYLDRLIEKGLFGTSRAQAAATVISDHCKLLIGQGRLAEAPIQTVQGPNSTGT